MKMNIDSFIYHEPKAYFTKQISNCNSNLKKSEVVPLILNLNKNNFNKRFWNPDFIYKNERSEIFQDYIWVICEEKQFRKSTFHRAISIFDNYAGKIHVNKEHIKLIPFVCLVIASKLNDDYQTSLILEDIREITSELIQDVSIELLNFIEKQILFELNYDLNLSTAYQNLVYLLHFVDIHKIKIPNSYKYNFIDRCFSLIDLLAMEYDFNKFDPLILANCILKMIGNISHIPVDLEGLLGKFFNFPKGQKDMFHECEQFITSFINKFFLSVQNK